MPTARVAFAGIPELTQEILCAALAHRPDIEVVKPWTRLPSLTQSDDVPEMLLVESDEARLPPALRAMLATAPRLRIIALASDHKTATVFYMAEQRTVMLGCIAEDFCTVFDPRK